MSEVIATVPCRESKDSMIREFWCTTVGLLFSDIETFWNVIIQSLTNSLSTYSTCITPVLQLNLGKNYVHQTNTHNKQGLISPIQLLFQARILFDKSIFYKSTLDKSIFYKMVLSEYRTIWAIDMSSSKPSSLSERATMWHVWVVAKIVCALYIGLRYCGSNTVIKCT